MHIEKFELATAIKNRMKSLEGEQKKWNELTSADQLCFTPEHYPGKPAMRFNNSIPDADFAAFRDQQLNRITQEIAALMSEFGAL